MCFELKLVITCLSGTNPDAKQGGRKEACFPNLGGAAAIV